MIARRLSLRYRIALTIFALEAVMMALVLWQTLSHQMDAAERQLAATQKATVEMMSGVARVALITEEYADLQPYLEQVQEAPHIRRILLTDHSGKVVASSSPALVGSQMVRFQDGSQEYWRLHDIRNATGLIGRLAVEFSRAPLVAANREALNLGITLAILGMAIIAVVGIAMGFLLTRRLDQLADAATRIASGNFDARAADAGRDEIANLARAFNRMAAEIEADIAKLRENEERFALAASATNDGIWDWHVGTGVVYFSPRCKEMLGYGADESWETFRDWRDHLHPDDLGRVLELWTGYMEGRVDHYQMEYRLRTRAGDYIWVQARGFATRDESGEIIRITGALTDITDQHAQAAALRHQALHDALTGLPNRTLFFDRLEQAVLGAGRERTTLAVLMMDLDRFKDINDTLGHHVGDQLLQDLGKRLQSVLRDSDTVARLGGDEFAILLPRATVLHATAVARKITQELEQPFTAGTHALEASASIGVALYPDHGGTPSALMQRADVAMYVAKQSHLDYAIYDVEQDEHSIGRLTLIAELRHAINYDQLRLHYQPTIDIRTGKVLDLEALVRWNHPLRGLLPPDEFVPLAERTGLIRPLTEWVLNNALRQMAAWRDQGIKVGMAVNLSARNLQDPEFAGLLNGLLGHWNIPPQRLTLELTESAIMVNPERIAETLTALDLLGVRLAIDDFGTGYSSLANLRGLPVDALKIDKSFVMDMEDDENDAVIVRSTIDLAHNLGLTVTAEGVTTREILDLLTILDCDAAQGFHLSRPLPAEDVPEWLGEKGVAGWERRPTLQLVSRRPG